MNTEPPFSKDITPHNLGDAIRLCRLEKGMTLKQVADASNLSVSYLSDVERGRTNPAIMTAAKIAEALDHTLVVGMIEDGESSFPCTTAESELLYALRAHDFKRFMLMATSILLEMHPLDANEARS